MPVNKDSLSLGACLDVGMVLSWSKRTSENALRGTLSLCGHWTRLLLLNRYFAMCFSDDTLSWS
jgi:hypothetical protein